MRCVRGLSDLPACLLLVLLMSLTTLAGCGTPSFLVTPVSNTNQLKEEVVKGGDGWSPEKIAIISIEGMLANARSGGFLQPTENPVSLFVQELRQAEADPKVVAVVLRINSPGGTVTASDTIYQELMRFKKKTSKPVIASSQEMAASGAYYVACAADKIVVQPTSIVGSIGVIFEAFDLEGTLQKLGIRVSPVQSGRFKDMGSPFRQRTVEEQALMQQMVDQYYQRFVAIVTERRGIKESGALQTVADGRVFTGQDAVKYGLADANGLLEDAVDMAAEQAKVKHPRVILYKRPYGYGGSIYASSSTPPPQANVVQLNVPALSEMLPSGFYYLWRP